MKFNEVKLKDKALFESYLAGKNYDLITYSFANFFIWRNWDPYTWTETDNALVIKSNYLDLDTICVPISADPQAIFNATETMIQLYKEQNRKFIISEVSSADLASFKKRWPNRFIARPYRPGFNYIYEHNDLAKLSGKKYDGKRNHINHFIRTNPDYSFLPLTTDLAKSSSDQLTKWLGAEKNSNLANNQEYQGTLDALKFFKDLGCIGTVLLIDNEVAGFTIGEPLNDDTFCIHIEKANTQISGCYQMINHQFAKEFIDGYKFINRAEDMGMTGLKKAKLSYHPCRLEKKYYLRLRDE